MKFTSILQAKRCFTALSLVAKKTGNMSTEGYIRKVNIEVVKSACTRSDITNCLIFTSYWLLTLLLSLLLH